MWHTSVARVVAAVSSCRHIVTMFALVCGYDSFRVGCSSFYVLADIAPWACALVIAPADSNKVLQKKNKGTMSRMQWQLKKHSKYRAMITRLFLRTNASSEKRKGFSLQPVSISPIPLTFIKIHTFFTIFKRKNNLPLFLNLKIAKKNLFEKKYSVLIWVSGMGPYSTSGLET